MCISIDGITCSCCWMRYWIIWCLWVQHRLVFYVIWVFVKPIMLFVTLHVELSYHYLRVNLCSVCYFITSALTWRTSATMQTQQLWCVPTDITQPPWAHYAYPIAQLDLLPHPSQLYVRRHVQSRCQSRIPLVSPAPLMVTKPCHFQGPALTETNLFSLGIENSINLSWYCILQKWLISWLIGYLHQLIDREFLKPCFFTSIQVR